ncbi:MAG: bacillithiol biosynthesis cysteine-adding enzyme BshC, partial [Spirosomaceae bacterium]|nr:bacillithiol biosynthesis cysteine-adding enzyme BshC [Spirosomataceae bacterium]
MPKSHEDHDFAEIASFNLFGKKYTWETEQKGAVGRMNPAELQAVLEQLPEKAELFDNAYNHGLISIDGDDRALKSLFSDVIKDDLQNHTANAIVSDTSKKIQELGYETQISPREINFFYLENGLRERIVKEDGQYKVLNSEIVFSESEILQLVDNEPEKFSPNVVLRPLYQQMILPNLAYIGGPSEVPYWLQ